MSQPKYTKKGLNGRQIDQTEFFFGNNSFSGADMVATMTISGTENTNGSHVLGSIQTLSYSIHQEKQPIRSIGNINAKDYVMGPRTIAGSLVFAVFDRHFAYAAMADIKREYKNYHFLADELPPFDITITYANEYGANSKLALYGVRLVNEGQVMSINDIYTENTYQFVATDIDYLDTQKLTDPILNKDTFNQYDPDSINASINYEDLIPNLETEEAETEEEVIKAINYRLEAKNIMPYYYDTGTYGSVDIYLTPQPKEKCNLRIKAFDNDFVPLNIELFPDSVFPVPIKNLRPGRYEAFANGYYGLAVAKSFTISTIKYDGDKEFVSTFMVYEKGDKDGYCYIRCESTQLLDGVEYIKKEDYENDSSAAWTAVMAPAAKRHFLLDKLEPETVYLLRGVYQDKVTTDHIEFTTTKLSINFDRYEYLKEFLKYNSSTNIRTSIYDSIIDAAKEYAKDKEGMTIAEAIWAIKDDNNMAYIDFCIMMATAYENQILWATSDTIKPPVLYSAAQSAILVDNDTEAIEIEKVGYCPSTVTDQQFDKTFDKWIYRLPGSEGLYRIKRFDVNGRLSIPMMIPVFNQEYRERLLSTETMIERSKEQAMNRTRVQVYEELKHLDEKDIEYAIAEYAEESSHFRTGVMQPVMVEHTDRYISFIHPVEMIHKLYCCIQPTDDLLEGKPIHKKLVTSNNQYYAKFDVLDQGLIDGMRYSVWYETEDFNKVGPVCSFYFNQEEDEILIAKNDIMIKTLYTILKRYSVGQTNGLLYEYIYNKIIDLDASLYSHYGEIYDKLIMDIYTNKDLSKRDSYLLLYYMFEIFMAINHESQVNYLAESKYYLKENSMVIVPREEIVIHRAVISPDGISKLSPLVKDASYALDLGFIRDHGNLGLIYFTTLDGKLVSKPIVIDYDHKTKIYGTYKEGR